MRSAIYSYEQRHRAELDPEPERRFRAHEAAADDRPPNPPAAH
jgi:hypothetical protein